MKRILVTGNGRSGSAGSLAATERHLRHARVGFCFAESCQAMKKLAAVFVVLLAAISALWITWLTIAIAGWLLGTLVLLCFVGLVIAVKEVTTP